jgi:hypothetical protein
VKITIFSFTILLIGSSLFFGLQAGFASDEQPKRDAAVILSKAAELVDLQARDRTPFLLLADVVLHDGDESLNGVFAMAWAAPGQYRRVFRFPNFTATEVVTDGTIYRQRNTDALPLMVWELDELLLPASKYRLTPQAKVRRIRTERSGAAELTCVLTQAPWTDSKMCVNTVTGEPFSIDRGVDAYRMESMREHFEFADYQPFEGRMFPHKLTFRGWNARVIEVQIQKLIRAQAFPSDEFSPPKGATRSHFCDLPESTGEVRPSTGNAIPIGLTDVEVDMYFQVSPVGGVRYAQVVYSSAPLKNNEILHWFIGTHFPVKTCSGTPIAYETMISLLSGH